MYDFQLCCWQASGTERELPVWQEVGKEWVTVTHQTSLVVQTVKNLPAMQETWVRSLGQEDPLEKEMATHSNSLAWRISWTEEPGGLYSPWGHKESHMTQQLQKTTPTNPSRVISLGRGVRDACGFQSGMGLKGLSRILPPE